MNKYILTFSVYVSMFEKQMEFLSKLDGSKHMVFTSFHIQEEFDKDYVKNATMMMKWLKNKKFKVIADVSKKTVNQFGYTDLIDFARDMGVDVLRIDYGYTPEEIADLSNQIELMFNASTFDDETVLLLKDKCPIACHNYYPRPETGLSSETYLLFNHYLESNGIEVMTFIAGDEGLRGPLYEGLPTLEKHRKLKPYVSALELFIKYKAKYVTVGDLIISDNQLDMIQKFLDENIISLPVTLDPQYINWYNKPLTIRIDSGAYAFRIMESREYSCPSGVHVPPIQAKPRYKGTITVDNELYKRYEGEIQIVHTDLPEDNRVNVIGKVSSQYLDLLDLIKGNTQIMFIPETDSSKKE